MSKLSKFLLDRKQAKTNFTKVEQKVGQKVERKVERKVEQKVEQKVERKIQRTVTSPQKVKTRALEECVCDAATSINFCVSVTVPPGFIPIQDYVICVASNTNDLHCQNLKCSKTIDVEVDNPCVPATPMICQGIVELNKLHYCGAINLLVNLAVAQNPVFQNQIDPVSCPDYVFQVSRYVAIPVDQDICIACTPFDCSLLSSPLISITNVTGTLVINPCETTINVTGTLNFDTTPCATLLRPTLFVADGFSDGDLYSVDETNAVSTSIGPLLVGGTDPVRVGGLAYNFGSNVLYGITTITSPNFPNRLVTINTLTAAVTVIDVLGSGLGANIIDITFDATGTTLYGVNSGNSGTLFTIDTATGVAMTVGAIGSNINGGGLSFLPLTSGPQNLWLSWAYPATDLLTIDPATGVQIAPGPLTLIPTQEFISGMTTNVSQTQLLGVNVNPLTGAHELISIDTTTGVVTIIGPLSSGSDGIAQGMA